MCSGSIGSLHLSGPLYTCVATGVWLCDTTCLHLSGGLLVSSGFLMELRNCGPSGGLFERTVCVITHKVLVCCPFAVEPVNHKKLSLVWPMLTYPRVMHIGHAPTTAFGSVVVCMCVGHWAAKDVWLLISIRGLLFCIGFYWKCYWNEGRLYYFW